MLHLFKSLDLGLELCFNVEASASLTEKQLERLKLILADGFVLESIQTESQLIDYGDIVDLGPRMNFATPDSTNLVTICHACGIPQIVRIECSRRYQLGADVDREQFVAVNHDKMTEMEYSEQLQTFASGITPEVVWDIPMKEKGPDALLAYDDLPFDEFDRQRYYDYFVGKLGRNPTCVEIWDLANADSDHSRHHAFSGKIIIDDVEMSQTLFEIVKSAHGANPHNSVIAFHDNASAIQGFKFMAILPEKPGQLSTYVMKKVIYHLTFSAETHNFPSGVAPYPGAQTGLGGWIRDMLCAGQGSLVHYASAGYCVGQLNISGYSFPWEEKFSDFKYPGNLANPLEIAIRASDGVSDYGNCFGVPTVNGFFRSFGARLPSGERVEFIKPVVYVGGGGSINDLHTKKGKAVQGLKIVRIGGPAYDVGFGGGAASSKHQGENREEVDLTAVQRGDAEMENKADKVIRACVAMGSNNPIGSAHDQGAGGPGNVLKEIVEEAGGKIYLRRINLGDPTLSVMKIWVAEYQEGFAFLISPERIEEFQAICARESVPCEVLGEVTGDGRFTVIDEQNDSTPVDIDLSFVSSEVPQKTFADVRIKPVLKPLELPEDLTLEDALFFVLREPSVACKNWLTDKVDRHVQGRTVLQPCVGPLGLALADCGITTLGYFDKVGSVTALGEQPYKLLLDPSAGARMAMAEMLTNMVWPCVSDIRDIKFSSNWMWAPKLPGERTALRDACVAMADFSKAIGVVPDGGKDSLSMATDVDGEMVKSLRQLVIGGYAPCPDVGKFVTPDIKRPGESVLIFVDPSLGQARTGGSALAHVNGGQLGDECPDIDNPELFKRMFQITQELISQGLILSGHDRSDGGLIVVVLEMAFGGNCGLDLDIPGQHGILEQLFAEEAGLVFEVLASQSSQVLVALEKANVMATVIGRTKTEDDVKIAYNGKTNFSMPMTVLREWWMETSLQMEILQSNPVTAREKYKNINDIGALDYLVPFDPKPTAPEIMLKARKYPTAILRDEGTNGHEEMTAAAMEAGLYPVDVHMTDLLEDRVSLDDFLFLITPGGFSHKDVPQSGKGFASKILFNEAVWEMYQRFLDMPNTLTLGVCNGCQVNTLLGLVPWKGIEPEKQPRLETNLSDKFESGWVSLMIQDSPSILHRGMTGSVLGAWVAHKQGRFYFPDETVLDEVLGKNLVTMTYVDCDWRETDKYPFNPNGSPHAIAGLTSSDGRHTVCMPHPIDRGFEMWQWPYKGNLQDLKVSPWLKMFQNAREFFEQY